MPIAASEQHHTYEDKFALAEVTTTLAAASWLGLLHALGLERASVNELAAIARAGSQRLTLRIRSTETCKLIRSAQRQEASDKKIESTSTLFGKSETKVVHTIHEYYWSLGHWYEVVIFAGATEDGGHRTVLTTRSSQSEVVTRMERAPRPESFSPPISEGDVTWLFAQLTPASTAASGDATGGGAPTLSLTIDRTAAKCLTPRRNPVIEAALEAAHELQPVLQRLNRLSEVAREMRGLDVNASSTPLPAVTSFGNLFAPVLPLMQPPTEDNADVAHADEPAAQEAEQQQQPSASSTPAPAGALVSLGERAVVVAVSLDETSVATTTSSSPSSPSVALSTETMRRMLGEESRALAERREALAAAFPPASDGGALLSAHEAWIATIGRHAQAVCAQYEEAVDYVESLLRTQLVAAIGRELTPSDFEKYMRFHAHKLLKPAYAPRPFCFAVRQPDKSPEGTVALETNALDDGASPIETLMRHLPSPSPPMTFALDAATTVTFHGERYIHGYIAHAFGSDARRRATPLTLSIRARQFSSFLVLLGRLGAGGKFEPTHGLIVRNKDELQIPLMLEQMPSAKEFRDAIASLSPAQQRFAKAYRAMQLEGSVFGLLYMQLRPQLEKVLRLPPDALTKEIALTQSLLTLFIEYQIPSDLLAYDGDAAAPLADKLAAVRGHVQAINDTLHGAKQAEVDAARMQHDFHHPACVPQMAAMSAPVMYEACAASLSCASMEDESEVFGATPRCKGGKGGGAPRGATRSCARSYSIPEQAKGAPPRPAAAAPPPPPSAPPPPPSAPSLPAPSSASAAPAKGGSSAPSQQQQHHQHSSDEELVDVGGSVELDFTKLPGELDAKLAELDADGALRPTKISVQPNWTKRSQAALLASPSTTILREAEQKREKQAAFDLLDALSRSGALPIECCALHVLLAATHCFDSSLLDTVIVKDVNPIEKLEKSALIVAETILERPGAELVRPDAYERVATFSAPALLPPPADAAE